MERQFKFRAFCQVTKEMKYFDFQTLHDKHDEFYSIHDVFVTSLKVMQYTGLKDKNGKEIYEGDIVTGNSFESSMLKHWNFDVEDKPEMYVIKYHHASFKTFDLKGRWVAVLNHHVSSMVEDLQVIGNIYENHELLKED